MARITGDKGLISDTDTHKEVFHVLSNLHVLCAMLKGVEGGGGGRGWGVGVVQWTIQSLKQWKSN